MKSISPLILALFFGSAAYAQVGIGTTTPNSNAVLELKSPGNNQGFLVPRLTTAERAAITLSSAENGMMIYDRDENKFYYWQDAQWLPIRSGGDLQAGSGIAITGNTIAVIPDGDGDPANEIQDLQLNGNTLSITGNSSPTTIDLAAYKGTNTDNQTLSFNSSTGDLAITGGNTVTVNATGSAGGVLSGTYPNPGLASGAGNTVLTVLNNASTTSVLQPSKVAAGLSGQVLTTVAGATVWANIPASSGGTVTSITTGTGLTGGPITSSGTISVENNGITSALLKSDATIDLNRAVTTNHIRDGAVTSQKLSNTGVAPATYGSSTQVPTFTVDAKGRITSATTVTVSGGGGGEGLAETLANSNDAKLYSAINLSAVSINTASTPGALNVNGSHFISFTTFADAYVIQPDDYIVIGVGGLKGGTVELPPAAESTGRMLIIRSTARSLTEAVTVVAADLIDGASTSEPLYLNGNIAENVAYTITVISDGKTWWTIDRGIADNRFKG